MRVLVLPKAPPKAPPFVGDVHFRLASDLDSFHHGDDLLSPDKTVPWTISPHSPANRAKLAEQLLLDGLASQMTLDEWAKIKPTQRLLYYCRQPFPLRFGTSCFAFYTATGERIGRCVLASPIADRRDANHHVLPYGGSQFEPYDDEVALRVLKIMEPVYDLLEDYDGYIHRPVEGALIQRSQHNSNTLTVVVRDSKSNMKDALMLPINFEDLP